MNKYFGYIRVSSARQGEGVSLQQQREAIARYSQQNSLEVTHWFEEQETAAKRGRPIFGRMMKELRQGRARGVIIHKIDRSARNLKDWADLGEVIDQGIEVHFANEALDLNSRGGRLSADIQAVIASDFIRNLREETKKGFYGRLKQGLFPMPAPTGYLNMGGGKAKQIDPGKAPLVKQVFEMYSTQRFNFAQMLAQVERMGLRGRSGRIITKNGLSKLLNNSFYSGIIRIAKTGESYAGSHEPLISQTLFERVQDILHGRVNTRAFRHDFLFRRRLKCKSCGTTLIGETHKSFVYYRCQTASCPSTSIREEAADGAVESELARLTLSPLESQFFAQKLAELEVGSSQRQEETIRGLQLQIQQVADRINRLTDAYIDRLIEKDLFEQRKTALLVERRHIQDELVRWQTGIGNDTEKVRLFLEQANAAYSSYKSGTVADKRELVDALTSNRVLDGKVLIVKLKFPLELVASRPKVSDGDPRRDIHRTSKRLLTKLVKFFHDENESQEKIAA